MNHRASRLGFTLIELLTVIAIIAILASMVFIAGPRMIEKAKITTFANNCNQIRIACVGYYPNNNDSYPPGYGFKAFIKPENRTDNDDELPDHKKFHLTPYTIKIGYFRNFDIYDNFSQDTYDTDRDGQLSLLEFMPVGTKTGLDTYKFPEEVYTGSNLNADVRAALNEQAPYAYIPINSKQYKKIADYYYNLGVGGDRSAWYMERWDPENNFFSSNNPYAPQRYDDYVIISVGPWGSTGGILTPPESFMNDLQSKVHPDCWYHVLAIRAYWLATRDIEGPNFDGNGEPDFDFRSRTHGDSGDPGSYNGENLNFLPDGSNGPGPLIYKPKA